MKVAATALASCIMVSLAMGGAQYAHANEPIQTTQSLLQSPVSGLAFPSTFGVPTAVAPRAGTGFVGATYANPRGGVSGAGGDGEIVAGYSIGNPIDAVSLTFGVALTGAEPLGDAGAFSISGSRILNAGGRSITFGGIAVSNLLAWGPNKNRPVMYSTYISHLVGIPTGQTEIPVQITVGYGTDTTRRADGSGILEDGLFAGVGAGVTENISLGLSATRTQFNLGATLTIPGTGVGATIGVFDVANNTERRQLSFSVGFGF